MRNEKLRIFVRCGTVFLSTFFIREAIKKGVLKGKLKDQHGILADSAENILTFLNNTNKCGEYEVFNHFGEFTKQ